MKFAQQTSGRSRVTWLFVAAVLMASFVWACSSETDPGPDADVPDSSHPDAPVTPDSSTPDSSTPDSSTPDSSTPDSSTPDSSTPDGSVVGATEPNLKVAFIGDTGNGADFRSVLQLVKREGADLVMIQGDLNYAFLGPAGDWFSVIDAEINTSAPKIPYFVAKGNHDVDWGPGYGPGLASRMASWGIPVENGDPTARNYSIVYKGLKIVMVDESETNPTRADYVKERLQNDTHLWKICSWHKNQRNANVGPKSDEMGWTIYENCRAQGAIVAQAHSHTYSRSKTLTNDTAQTVDPTCSDPFGLCVGPGRHFFFDSSLGGYDVRPLDTTTAAKPHWASTYTGSFGALFLEFNVGGDPRKALGYFKTTGNVIIDPPASSGKTSFTITRTP